MSRVDSVNASDRQDLRADAEELLGGVVAEVEKPTLENLHTYAHMSLETIRAHLASRERTNSVPTDAAVAKLEMIKSDYRKNIALVAWACDISESTAEQQA